MQEWKLQPAHDLGLKPTERWQSLRREGGLVAMSCHITWALAVRTYLRIWHRLEIVGGANLPAEPPFVLVANHASHLDALALASPLPLLLRNRIFALAAGDVFFDRTLRAAFAATFLNALPLWRRKTPVKALAELRQRLLEEPCAYVIFPEGTRARDGRLARFKPGIGMMVAGTNVPVVPCHLQGTFEAWPCGRPLPAPRKIQLRIGKPLHFANLPNEREGWDQIATTLHDAVAQLDGTGTKKD